MKLLLDTHILLWLAAGVPPSDVADYVLNEENELYFSPASIWEIIIKRGLNRSDFEVDPHLLYKGLVDNGYEQINITSKHVLLTGTLPMLHKDPFDRILLAQSLTEGITLLTADEMLTKYPAPVILAKK